MINTKVKSRNEKQNDLWLSYFKNIDKTNRLIGVILECYKELEDEINKAELNFKNRKEEKFEDNRRIYYNREFENKKSILPEYVQYMNIKELRQNLYKVENKIEKFKQKIDNAEIFVDFKLKQRLEHYYKLKEKLDEIEQETEKPSLDNIKFTSLYLENFKGFSLKNDKKANTVNISPITLIYGPNSYGKSSILQSLLLLNQTVREGEDYKNTTLLPNGATVKLGKFSDFINKNDTSKELKIEIGLPFDNYFDKKNKEKKQTPSILAQLFYAYHFKLIKEQIVLSEINISVILKDYSDPKQVLEFPKKLIYTLRPNSNQSKNTSFEIIRYFKDDISIEEIYLGDDCKKQIVERISFFKLEEFLANSPFEHIENIIKNLIYVSSFRTQPERYYVPENNRRIYVGKNGEFTAEILGYDTEVNANVNSWLNRIAGYKLSLKKDKNVNSVNLDDNKTNIKDINLLDLGSGIAQVLPIITQSFKSKNDVILIEEPEIHLHPRAQAELGEMFADAIQKTGNTFIIETHSENLLLRLEKLIRRGELSKDDVSVIYVDKNDSGSYCIPLILDDDGDITNINEIPDGFFEEGFNELFDVSK